MTEASAELLPKKEDVTNLLSAFGNSESKALTLLLMEPGQIYSNKGLRTLVKKAQGEHVEWDLNDRTVAGYCSNSLIPIGLVAREEITETGGFGFVKTEYGEKTGDPLAALLLNYSLDHPGLSLRQLLGETQSPSSERSDTGDKKRSPAVRIKIYRELLGKGSLTVFEIQGKIGEGGELVAKHLRLMNSMGLVKYEAAGWAESLYEYSFSENAPDEQPTPFVEVYPNGKKYTHTRLTQDLLDHLKGNKGRKFSIGELSEILERKYKEEGILPPKAIVAQVGLVLAYLERTEYLERSGFEPNTRSLVEINPEKREAIAEFLQIIDDYQSGDSEILKQGEALIDEIKKSPEKASLLLKKAREGSPWTNMVEVGQQKIIIQKAIRLKPGTTNKELYEELKERGVKTSQNRIAHITAEMEKEGIISSTSSRGHKGFVVQQEV